MLTGKNIMLIDDDEVNNMINTILIGKFCNANVQTYTRGSLALDWLKSGSTPDDFPQILLLDVNMPAMDGWDFLEEFQKLPVSVTSSCQIFLLSSSVDHDDVARSKTYGMVKGFFSKPLTIEVINKLSS